MRKKTKFLLLRSSIILAFAILAGRVWYVQVVMGSYYKQQADTSKIRIEPVEALRGIIYDRSGRQLVWNAPSWNVEIVPHGVPRSGAMAIYRHLAGLLNNRMSAEAIRQLVAENAWRAYAPVIVARKVSPDTAMLIKQLHSELPGVRADPSSVRQYVNDPQSSLAHIVGYASAIDPSTYSSDLKAYPRLHYELNDQAGQMGIEEGLDPYLHGVNGSNQVEVDAGERPIRVLRYGTTSPGDSVYLTIDWKLQQQVANDLAAALTHLQQQGANVHQAVAVVEDVHTGQILAMVSLPGFDNNAFSQGNNRAIEATLKNPARPLFNLATQGQYPPGSTFKIITASAALQTGAITPQTTVDDTGAIKLQGHTFFGWKPGGLGPVNVVQALALSSDIFMYTVAGGNPNLSPDPPHAGPNAIAHYAQLFGLGQYTGIGDTLPGDFPGLIPTPHWFNDVVKPGPLKNPGDIWTIGYTYNMAIGQGFDLATPLQMVDVAATVANGGTLFKPQLIDRVAGRVSPLHGVLRRPTVIQPFVPQIIRRNFVAPANLALIQEGMHQAVVTGDWNVGTSALVHDPRIDAAGKTGTAEDNPRPPHSWWVGYAPFSNPKIAVCVMVPNAGGEGAYVSAPIAHKIFEDYFHLQPMLPDHPGDHNWLDDVSPTLVGGGGSQ